jgi:PadR family transcriptional regulator, regulatory protein PadR
VHPTENLFGCSAHYHIPLDTNFQMPYTVGVMATNDNLGTFEQIILTSLVILGENAYGATVHEKVEELAEGSRSIGSVYTTLDRLEQKGYVKSWFGDPTPERGGRAKRFFKITAAGQRVLDHSMRVAGNMLAGLEGIGGVA